MNALRGPIDNEAESGAEIYRLGADERYADNIYGEQPYGDATGRWIAIRYYAAGERPGPQRRNAPRHILRQSQIPRLSLLGGIPVLSAGSKRSTYVEALPVRHS